MGAWGFLKGYKLLGHLNHLHCQHTAIALSRGWKFLKKGPLNGVWVRKWMYVQGCQLSWIIKGTLHFVSEIWIWNLIWNLDTPHNVHPSGFARLCFCFQTLPLSNAVFWLADTFVGFSLISRLAKEWLRTLKKTISNYAKSFFWSTGRTMHSGWTWAFEANHPGHPIILLKSN